MTTFTYKDKPIILTWADLTSPWSSYNTVTWESFCGWTFSINKN